MIRRRFSSGLLQTLATKEEAGTILMAINLAFITEDFNDNTLSVLERTTVFSDVWEMPVVDGSGHFCFARGYRCLLERPVFFLNSLVKPEVVKQRFPHRAKNTPCHLRPRNSMA
ncbi:hypothetical protein KSP39_PZI019458 [Platanthera zijinensis]|uniref:Dirigent protein n=1 Tax=Platanthera zijinensis TaxID=2320716 RepID=A0AAP0B259_9ASPA